MTGTIIGQHPHPGLNGGIAAATAQCHGQHTRKHVGLWQDTIDNNLHRMGPRHPLLSDLPTRVVHLAHAAQQEPKHTKLACSRNVDLLFVLGIFLYRRHHSPSRSFFSSLHWVHARWQRC